MKKFFLPAFLMFVYAGCNNLEDAGLTKRNTFVRFYEGANSFVAAEAHVTADGGYALVGTIRAEGDNPISKIIFIRTDQFGQKVWEKIIDGGIARSLRISGSKYIIVGDSVKYDANSDELADLVNTAARIIQLDEGSQDIDFDLSFSRDIVTTVDDEERSIHIDFHTNGVTEDASGNLITLGTFKRPGAQEKALITAFNPLTMDTAWVREYDYINRDYVNTKSLFYSRGKVLWGASITESASSFSRSYVAVPVIEENSSFVNSNYFGQNGDQLFLTINDLKPSPYGYAATGTYSSSDGSKSNMFMIQIDGSGNFLPETQRYFDSGTDGAAIATPDISVIQDGGRALTTTHDGGFVIAGVTTNQVYGGLDIWLVKTDVTGSVVWSKAVGGRSSEAVASIELAPDGGFIICGTLSDGSSEIGGLSSIFLIKTDSNGELKD